MYSITSGTATCTSCFTGYVSNSAKTGCGKYRVYQTPLSDLEKLQGQYSRHRSSKMRKERNQYFIMYKILIRWIHKNSVSDACDKGQYRGQDDSHCLPCEVNTYSDAGDAFCLTCSLGEVSSSDRSGCGEFRAKCSFVRRHTSFSCYYLLQVASYIKFKT